MVVGIQREDLVAVGCPSATLSFLVAQTIDSSQGYSGLRRAASQARTSASAKRQYFPSRKPGIRSRDLSRVCPYTQEGGTLRISATSLTVSNVSSRAMVSIRVSLQ